MDSLVVRFLTNNNVIIVALSSLIARPTELAACDAVRIAGGDTPDQAPDPRARRRDKSHYLLWDGGEYDISFIVSQESPARGNYLRMVQKASLRWVQQEEMQ